MTAYEPPTAQFFLHPTGLHGMCHSYPDRPPILVVNGAGWSLTMLAGHDADPDDVRSNADELARLAGEYAAAAREWAERRPAESCACGQGTAGAPS